MILLFVPAFFLLLYGYALNFDIRHVALAVEDDDQQRGQPRARLGASCNSGYFDLVADVVDERRRSTRPDGSRRRRARSWSFRRGSARDLRAGRRRPVQVLINGDNANTATTVMGYASTHRRRRVGRATSCRHGRDRRAARC